MTHPTTPFPLYLLPSIPFRRRRSSQISTSTTSITSSPSSSPPAPSYLSSTPTSHLRCQKCLTDLIPTSSIISKGFTGRHGRAYLVSPPPPSLFARGSARPVSESTSWTPGDLPNTLTHKAVPRQLVTGAHTVSDISCRTCGSVLGWKYVGAEEDAQKYKVGKFILETRRVVKSAAWEDSGSYADAAETESGLGSGLKAKEGDDIEFDSQDEDECEDLFSGVWSPRLAAKRRKNKVFGRE